MPLRIPIADPPISDSEIAFLRDHIVGTAPIECDLHDIAEGVFAACLNRWADRVLEQAGIILVEQVVDFARRMWCYQQIAMQLWTEKVAIDFPDSSPAEVLEQLKRQSAASDFGLLPEDDDVGN